jgi:hypothetical protein
VVFDFCPKSDPFFHQAQFVHPQILTRNFGWKLVSLIFLVQIQGFYYNIFGFCRFKRKYFELGLLSTLLYFEKSLVFLQHNLSRLQKFIIIISVSWHLFHIILKNLVFFHSNIQLF